MSSFIKCHLRSTHRVVQVYQYGYMLPIFHILAWTVAGCYLLLIHAHHMTQCLVTSCGEVVFVAPHLDGVQPLIH